jgi:hypothetical protein
MLSKSGPVFTNELCSLILDKNHRTNIQLYPSYTILLPLKSRFVSVLKLEPHHEDIHCLIKYREMETYWGSERVDSCIIDLGIRWGCVWSVTCSDRFASWKDRTDTY